MKAMVMEEVSDLRQVTRPLIFVDRPIPEPKKGEILVRVATCGVCHTELDEIEGRTRPPRLPVIPGHQVVGRVEETGTAASQHQIGSRVGIGWIFDSCGKCEHCTSGNENLCANFQATGRDADGGYAEYMAVPEGSAYQVPDELSDAEAAPLLCAGAIGYRSLRLSGLRENQALGLTGFGASAHLVLKTVRYLFEQVRVYVFTRSTAEQQFARELGAIWAGNIDETSPEKLNCIIDTTPVWKPIIEGLRNLAPGGRLVINAIRKEELDKEILLNIDYPTHMWMEKEIKSVANVSRQDIREFLKIAAAVPIKPEIQEYGLQDANCALLDLKNGQIRGAKVLLIN